MKRALRAAANFLGSLRLTARKPKNPADWVARDDVPPHVLIQLCDDADDELVRVAATHPKHTAQSLAQLARHGKARVRAAVAGHPNVTVDLLNVLLEDPEVFVREEARKHLPPALLLAVPEATEHRWDDDEGIDLLFPDRHADPPAPDRNASAPEASPGFGRSLGDSAVHPEVASPLFPLFETPDPEIGGTSLPPRAVTPEAQTAAARPAALRIAELTPEALAEALLELTSEAEPVDQATLFETFAQRHGQALDAPLELRLLHALKRLSAARRVNRIIAKPDPVRPRRSDVLVERCQGRFAFRSPKPLEEPTRAGSDVVTAQDERLPQRPPSPPTVPEPELVGPPRLVSEPVPDLVPRQASFVPTPSPEEPQHENAPTSTPPPHATALETLLFSLAVDHKSSLEQAENAVETLPAQPNSARDADRAADFFWLPPVEGGLTRPGPAHAKELGSSPLAAEPDASRRTEAVTDSFDLYLPFKPAKPVAGDSGKRTLRERAEQLAANLVADYHLEPGDVDPLADVLEVTAVGQVRQAVERLLQRGATTEEITLCFELKCLWLECPDYNLAWTYRRASGWSTYRLYENLSWPLALRFVRGFNGLPHLDEVHYTLELHFERWCRVRRYGSHYSFVSYLTTLTDGFEHAFDCDYYNLPRDPAAR